MPAGASGASPTINPVIWISMSSNVSLNTLDNLFIAVFKSAGDASMPPSHNFSSVPMAIKVGYKLATFLAGFVVYPVSLNICCISLIFSSSAARLADAVGVGAGAVDVAFWADVGCIAVLGTDNLGGRGAAGAVGALGVLGVAGASCIIGVVGAGCVLGALGITVGVSCAAVFLSVCPKDIFICGMRRRRP